MNIQTLAVTLGGGIAAVLVFLQLIPAERTNPPATSAMALPTGDTGAALRAACMDCHSNETVWPWYSSVAPVKFLVVNHVVEGRDHLNFSTWGEMSATDQDHALEEIVEVLEDGEMPLAGYTALHADARLTDAQKRLIMEWARTERASLQPSRGVSDQEQQERTGPSGEHHDEDRG